MGADLALLVHARGAEARLALRVACLSLAERLVHSARMAGLRQTVIISSRPQLLPEMPPWTVILPHLQALPESASVRYLVLGAGYLPDVTFLRELAAAADGKTPCRVQNTPALVCGRSQLETLVPRLFGNSAAGGGGAIGNMTGMRTLRPDHGRIFDLRDGSAIPAVEKALFKTLVKDTEGFMSRHVERRISLALSRRLVNTAVTPNQMTLASVAVGLGGALCMALGTRPWQVAGALLFLAHSILDGCDGEIARVKFMQSRLGGILDFWGDNVVHTAVFLAIGHAWWHASASAWAIVFSVLAAGGTMAAAGLVYIRTMMRKEGDGPLFTSVSATAGKSRIAAAADFLSRRDFIYLVVILAFWGHLNWFLAMAGLGAPAFFLVLLWLDAGERNGRQKPRVMQKH